jgi:ABC-type dipeptide/oligopeptide/nickel transport system ATPase component
MTKLLLKSLQVLRFRPFNKMRLEKLGRINLVVGKNNVGKSSLLEAIWLYARRGSPILVRSLLDTRDETRIPEAGEIDSEEQLLAIRNLFYGRSQLSEQTEPIVIGPLEGGSEILSLAVQWYVSQRGEDNVLRLQPISEDELTTVENPQLGIRTQINERVINRALTRYTRRRAAEIAEAEDTPCIYIPANGVDQNTVGVWWDKTTLTTLEPSVYDALHIISSDITGINFVASNEYNVRDPRTPMRVPIARVTNFETPVPLKSLGDGINRVFSISLALANTKNGILLIDEIENGIHYSVQVDVWHHLFRLARQLNVQIFATTHSWDCIEAFQKAAQEDTKSEGLLIRLGFKKGDVVPTIFTESELAVITREQIEVR